MKILFKSAGFALAFIVLLVAFASNADATLFTIAEEDVVKSTETNGLFKIVEGEDVKQAEKANDAKKESEAKEREAEKAREKVSVSKGELGKIIAEVNKCLKEQKKYWDDPNYGTSEAKRKLQEKTKALQKRLKAYKASK